MSYIWNSLFKIIKVIGILICIVSGVLLLGTAGASDIGALGVEETIEKVTLYTILIIIGAVVVCISNKMLEEGRDEWF